MSFAAVRNMPSSRKRLQTVLLLLLVFPALSHAGREERDFLRNVYKGSGNTLYCREPLDASARFKIDMVFSEKQLLQHYGCITARQCASKPGFTEVASDLHNMYPVERQVFMDRRGSSFDDSPDNVEKDACGYSLSYQIFEPPDHAKGNVARALVYMNSHHGIPLPASIVLMQQWNELDPPDAEEKARNDAIEAIQGNRNPYIDDPASLNDVSGLDKRW